MTTQAIRTVVVNQRIPITVHLVDCIVRRIIIHSVIVPNAIFCIKQPNESVTSWEFRLKKNIRFLGGDECRNRLGGRAKNRLVCQTDLYTILPKEAEGAVKAVPHRLFQTLLPDKRPVKPGLREPQIQEQIANFQKTPDLVE